MTSNLTRFSKPLALSLLLPLAPLRAEDESLRNLLRDALYTEEVNREPDKAAQQYEELLAKLDEQRAFAATALFRLAEVRRKQGRKDEAIQLYQRLIREFPSAGPESKLAAENLATLGAKVPSSGDLSSDEEMAELRRLQGLAINSPDVVNDPKIMENAASNGWLKVIEYLMGLGQDPYKTEALPYAADAGYLNVCKRILEIKGPPPQTVADLTLQEALRGKRVEVLKLLLANKGFDPNRVNALSAAVGVRGHEWSPEITSILVKAGADLNAMPPETVVLDPTNSGLRGAPLHQALALGNIAAATYLLDQGCKPDLATPDYNVSPLHYAVTSTDPEMLPIVKRLLAAGADANREVSWHRDDGMPGWSRATPLEMAVSQGNKGAVELLLAAKAETNRKILLKKAILEGNPQVLALLLDAGLDPNASTFPILYAPAEVPVVDWLVSPNPDGRDSGADVRPVLELLLDRGAKPSPEQIRTRFKDAQPRFATLLLRRFVYSELSSRPAITGILQRANWFEREKELATKEGDASPPQFASFYGKLSDILQSNSNAMPSLLAATVLRHQEGGGFREIPVDLTKDEQLPDLEWGDIIEFKDSSQQQRNSQEISWLYRKHLSASVSIEIGGVKSTYRMEGKRLAYDVTKDVIPWATAGQLVDLLWNTPLGQDELASGGVTVSVKRKDWPVLRMAFPSAEATRFALRSGDELALEVPAEVQGRINDCRKKVVEITAPRFPYRIYFPSGYETEEPEPPAATFPTLAQAIAEIYGGKSAINTNTFRGNENATLGYLAYQNQAIDSFAVLPYPDLGQISIRRLLENGTEETLKVDWSKAIAEVKAEQAAGELKKLDVALRAGDIVELAVRKDRPAGDWRGFSQQEELLLSKMLEGKIQFIDTNNRISLQPLAFKSPAYLETSAGWLPTLPPGGSPSMRASALLRENRNANGNLVVTRDGVESPGLYDGFVFLRDGDVVRAVSSLPGQFMPAQPGQPQRQHPSPPSPGSR